MLALGVGAIVGLVVGRLLSLLALIGLDVLQVDQTTRGALAGEEGLALRLVLGLGYGLVVGVIVGMLTLGGIIAIVGPQALAGRRKLLSRAVIGVGLGVVAGVFGGLLVALVLSLMGAGESVNASGLGGLGIGLGIGLLVGLTAVAHAVGSGGLGGFLPTPQPNPDGEVLAERLCLGWSAGLVLGIAGGLVMGLVGLGGLGGLTRAFVALIALIAAAILVTLGALVGAWWAAHD